jgi:UPF0716 family protein affecting phage T7 exclusion
MAAIYNNRPDAVLLSVLPGTGEQGHDLPNSVDTLAPCSTAPAARSEGLTATASNSAAAQAPKSPLRHVADRSFVPLASTLKGEIHMSITTLVGALPNGGRPFTPDTDQPEVSETLAGFAMEGAEAQTKAQAWAEKAYDRANTNLRVQTEAMLETVNLRTEIELQDVARHRTDLANTATKKTYMTADKAGASRSRLDRRYVWAGIAIILIGCLAEGKLLYSITMVSGLLGLTPGVFSDVIFAAAFAALPLLMALMMRSYLSNLETKERLRRTARFARAAKLLSLVWIAVMPLTFAPHLGLAGANLVDPFAEVPAWSQKLEGTILAIQSMLKLSSNIGIILVIILSILAASLGITSLMMSDREAVSRALVESVRDDENAVFARQRIDDLLTQRQNTDLTSRAPLKGILAEIDAGRGEFADRVVSVVTSVQEAGEAARRAEIRKLGASSRVIQASQLFKN